MTTSIHLDDETRDRLRAHKTGGETYDETLNRILDERDHRLADAEPQNVPESAPRDESGDPILNENEGEKQWYRVHSHFGGSTAVIAASEDEALEEARGIIQRPERVEEIDEEDTNDD